jgi:hypothetical protein
MTPGTTAPAIHEHDVSAAWRPRLALLAATLALLIGGAAHAQDAAAPPLQAPLPPPLPDQSRQHYVPQHFDRNGVYVPPHYEAPKPTQFRGYFADKEAQRQREKQHGYQEPTPNYTTQPAQDGQQGQGNQQGQGQ